MNKQKVLVMGVSGSGKSCIGERLAKSLGETFYDGDDFHPQSNIDKMSQGIPLNDEDRQGWLETLNRLFVSNGGGVIACSALKPQYRSLLIENNPELITVYLRGSFDTIWARYQKRKGHFFTSKNMLQSQFDTLVEPSTEEAIFVDVEQNVDQVVEKALCGIRDWSDKLGQQTGA
ncbi:gluconokinase [Vibrio galatheae]|uniref:gluconokinase n=1 Tax=Vibrio galatheae TaxID=579748 RepID=UPI0005FA5A99|nr:gluconokinase [Vibrio galatheae]